MSVRRVRSSLEVERGGLPRAKRPPPVTSSLAGHVPSLKSQSLLGEQQKVISWALISELVKGAVGNSSQLISISALAHCGVSWAAGVWGTVSAGGRFRALAFLDPACWAQVLLPAQTHLGTVLSCPCSQLWGGAPPRRGSKPCRFPSSLKLCSVKDQSRPCDTRQLEGATLRCLSPARQFLYRGPCVSKDDFQVVCPCRQGAFSALELRPSVSTRDGLLSSLAPVVT